MLQLSRYTLRTAKLNSITANRIARLQNNDPTPDLSGSGADTGILVVVGAIAGRRTRDWRIRVLGQPTDAAASVAAALEWSADAVRIDRSDLLIALATDDDAAGALRRLVERGIAVHEIARRLRPLAFELEFGEFKQPGTGGDE